jgi:hypothetical protein
MLRHAVQREKVSSHWMPPNSLRHQVGTRSRKAAIDGQKGDPFTDVQILTLLDGLPDTEAGRPRADAIRLMAELGLRPIELQHLSVCTDANSSEPHWWCTYRKRSGGGITDPKRLFPLPLMDSSGEVQPAGPWGTASRCTAAPTRGRARPGPARPSTGRNGRCAADRRRPPQPEALRGPGSAFPARRWAAAQSLPAPTGISRMAKWQAPRLRLHLACRVRQRS